MNRFLNVVLRDSLLESPFASKEKCEIATGAIIGAAAINGLANLYSSYKNLQSQADANSTNYAIAEMNRDMQRETNLQNVHMNQQTNAMNRLIAKEQNEFNERMYERQLYENSPQRQVELLKAAGLNPSAMFGQTTPASQLQAADQHAAQAAYATAPQLNYQMRPIDYSGVGNAVGSAVNTYYQTKLMNEQAKKTMEESKNIGVNTEKESRSMQSYIDFLSNQAKKEGIQGDLARKELELYKITFNTRVSLMNGDLGIQQMNQKIMQENLNGVLLDNQMKQIMQSFQTQMNEKQLQQMDATLQQIRANIGLINANKMLTDEQRLHEIEKKTGTIIENGMKGIDKSIKEQTKSFVIDSAREDLYLKEDMRYMRPFEYNYKFTGKAGQYFEMPSGQFGAAEMFELNRKRNRFKR